MNINNSGIGNNRSPNQADTISKKGSVSLNENQQANTAKGSQGDTVKISQAGKQLSQLESSLQKDASIDAKHQEKVARLKVDIESGAYSPNAQAIARNIVSFEAGFS